MTTEQQSTRSLPPVPVIAGIGLSGVAAALTLVFAGLVAYVAMYDAPYWDLWQHINRDHLLTDLFSRNNEHPVVTNRLLFWIDDGLFAASSRFVQAVALLALAAQVLLFVWLARMAGITRPILAVAPVAIVFVLNPFGFENTIWIFQVSMVLAFTSAVGAFVCFAAFAKSESQVALGGSIAFSLIAVLSFANGLFVPTLVVAMALWLRPRSAFPFVLIAVAAWAWQLTSPGAPGAPGSGISPESIGGMLVHFLTQLGAPIGFAAGILPQLGAPPINNLHVSLQAGVVVAILSALAIAFIALRARRDPAAIAALAIILFTLITAALIALSRGSTGPEQAMSSRYNINAALLYVTLLIVALMAAGIVERQLQGKLGWIAAVLAIPLLVVAITGAFVFQSLGGRYRAALEGTTALVAGALDPGSVGQLSFDMSLAMRETEEFRKHRTWMFAAPVTLRVGEKLTADEAAAPACNGATIAISEPDPQWEFRKAEGTLPRQQLSVGAIHVLITDASGTVAGYGHVPRRVSDLNPFAQQDGAVIGWVGRIRHKTAPPYAAWLADDRVVRCKLGSPG